MIKRGIVGPQYEEVWGNENKEENQPDSAGRTANPRPANQ